jgi:hypothetical protein
VKQRPASSEPSSSNNAKDLFQRNHLGCETSDFPNLFPPELNLDPSSLYVTSSGPTNGIDISHFECVQHDFFGDFNPLKFDMSWSPRPAYNMAFNYLPIEERLHSISRHNDLFRLGSSKDDSTRALYFQPSPCTNPESQVLAHLYQGVYPTALSSPL